MTNILGSGPLAGISVKVCSGGTDLFCEQPQHPPVTTNANGEVELTVNANSSGYAELTGNDSTGQPLAPTLYFFNPPVRADMEISAMQMVAPRILGLLAGSVAGSVGGYKAGTGVILLNILNCLNLGAPGVTLSTNGGDSSTVVFYADGSTPVPGLTATQATGYGGFVNVPVSAAGASPVSVAATLQGTSTVVGDLSVLVRPDTLTIARIVHDG